MSAETASLLQFLATLGLVFVSAAYVWTANRQADAAEQSLRLLTRGERSKAVGELHELKGHLLDLRNILPEYSHRGALKQNLGAQRSHQISEGRLQKMRVLSSGLKVLKLNSASLALEAVVHAETVRRKWGAAGREVQEETSETPALDDVHAAAQETERLLREALRRADEELEELPGRPV